MSREVITHAVVAAWFAQRRKHALALGQANAAAQQQQQHQQAVAAHGGLPVGTLQTGMADEGTHLAGILLTQAKFQTNCTADKVISCLNLR